MYSLRKQLKVCCVKYQTHKTSFLFPSNFFPWTVFYPLSLCSFINQENFKLETISSFYKANVKEITKMINRDFCTGFLVSMSITALVFIIINGLTGFSSSENTNPHSSSMFVESKQTNINKNNPLTLRSRSIFVMGDSSVDCRNDLEYFDSWYRSVRHL